MLKLFHKKENKKKENNKKEEIDIKKRIKEIEDELEKQKKTGEYRKLAEKILKNFQVKNPEKLTDDEIIKEFSKFSHPDTVFNRDLFYHAGDITKAEPTTKIEGIIWASFFAPDFIKHYINAEEFLKIWQKSRKDIIGNDGLNEISIEDFLKKLVENEKKFLINKTENDVPQNIINIEKLLNIVDEIYKEIIKEKLGYTIPTQFEILDLFFKNYLMDFYDILPLIEQKVENNEKKLELKIIKDFEVFQDFIEELSEEDIEDNEEDNDTDDNMFEDEETEIEDEDDDFISLIEEDKNEDED